VPVARNAMKSPNESPSAQHDHGSLLEGMEDIPAALKDRVSSSLERAHETAREMAGFFSPSEGAFLCETFKNADFPVKRFDEWPLLLSWDVEDVEKYEKLGARFDVNVPDLLEKMEDITHDQALWLLMAIGRFWRQRKERGETDEFYAVEL